MTTPPQDVTRQLDAIAASDDFEHDACALTDAWVEARVGLEAVEPILRFMEAHPALEFGSPGPLVHFVERFHGEAYEALLSASVQRKPTAHTIWMLNRLINGTAEPTVRSRLISLMAQVRQHPLVDEAARSGALDFLERLERIEAARG